MAETETETAAPKFKFRLLAGWHFTDDGQEHGPGSVFEDVHELDKMFNTPSGKKFERLESSGMAVTAVPQIRDKFDNMNIAQLREFAAEEEIDVSGLTKKADIIAKIRETPGLGK